MASLFFPVKTCSVIPFTYVPVSIYSLETHAHSTSRAGRRKSCNFMQVILACVTHGPLNHITHNPPIVEVVWWSTQVVFVSLICPGQPMKDGHSMWRQETYAICTCTLQQWVTRCCERQTGHGVTFHSEFRSFCGTQRSSKCGWNRFHVIYLAVTLSCSKRVENGNGWNNKWNQLNTDFRFTTV